MLRDGTGAIAFGLWALLGVPMLCMAGVLVHPCDCGEPSSCDHEADCSNDPCSDLIVCREQSSWDLGVEVPVPLSYPVVLAAEPESSARAFQARIFESPPRRNLPCPACDIPLLN